MQHHSWDRIREEQLNPLLSRQMIHSGHMTIARIHLKKGAIVPLHSHPNEQVSTLERGALRFVIDGQETVLRPGQLLEIPPGVPHSAEALEDSLAIDLFSPPRADWIRGDDAYLRNATRP